MRVCKCVCVHVRPRSIPKELRFSLGNPRRRQAGAAVAPGRRGDAASTWRRARGSALLPPFARVTHNALLIGTYPFPPAAAALPGTLNRSDKQPARNDRYITPLMLLVNQWSRNGNVSAGAASAVMLA